MSISIARRSALAAIVFTTSLCTFTRAEIPLPAPSQTTTPVKIDLTQFKLTWQDEFDGNAIDPAKWQAPVEVRQGASRWNPELVTVKDGLLRLGIRKTSDPTIRYELGGLRTQHDYDPSRTLFEQKYGYFEVRCKLPRNAMADYWGAFWMMSGEISDQQGNTTKGVEIDILETFCWVPHLEHAMTFHWNGYGLKHNAATVPCGKQPEVLDGEFHTFGFYWDESIYVSFVDGVEVGRTDMKGLGRDENGKVKSTGTSQAPAHLLLTCEAAPWAGKSPNWESDMPAEDEFIVDYVRVYTGKLSPAGQQTPAKP